MQQSSWRDGLDAVELDELDGGNEPPGPEVLPDSRIVPVGGCPVAGRIRALFRPAGALLHLKRARDQQRSVQTGLGICRAPCRAHPRAPDAWGLATLVRFASRSVSGHSVPKLTSRHGSVVGRQHKVVERDLATRQPVPRVVVDGEHCGVAVPQSRRRGRRGILPRGAAVPRPAGEGIWTAAATPAAPPEVRRDSRGVLVGVLPPPYRHTATPPPGSQPVTKACVAQTVGGGRGGGGGGGLGLAPYQA